MAQVRVADIKVEGRHRRDFGDLDSLTTSLKELGQLQPIVVTRDLSLVAGGRRLAAAQRLGWDTIEVFVADSLTDMALRLQAERDENTCRKAFTPSEEYALYRALLDLSGPTDRKGASGKTPVKTRKEIASIVSGGAGSHERLDRIGELIEISTDVSLPDRVRAVAQDAIKEIDRAPYRLTDAYKRTQLQVRAARETAEGDAAWSPEERQLRDRLIAGQAVVVTLRDEHRHLCQWATVQGRLIRVDRQTEWGNPFELPYDGTREEVIANYRDFYLPHKPSLTSRVQELRGYALACWCAPEPCHGDVLVEIANHS
jgi:ParB family chromosome partitioning protein